MATRYTYDPRYDEPVAPGEQIREILEERGVSQVDFAARMGKSAKFISQLINGKASLTHETALELERVIGVPSSFWNNAESIYRDVLARQERESESADLTAWAKKFPLKQMKAHGWLAGESTPQDQAEELLSYFGVSSVDAYQGYWGSDKRLAARMSTAYSAEVPALTAWLRAGERDAEKVSAAPYNEAGFRSVLEQLRPATRLHPKEWQPELTDGCASVGVVVVLVPDLPGTRCHGVSWWASRVRAVIQLGLRYGTDDQLWFSFFHEAGHILLDERGRSGIADLDGDPETEARMDQFAADLLIPPSEYQTFRASGRPSKASVTQFAEAIGIAPSIVVGRLQREGVIGYDTMNGLKTKLEWVR